MGTASTRSVPGPAIIRYDAFVRNLAAAVGVAVLAALAAPLDCAAASQTTPNALRRPITVSSDDPSLGALDAPVTLVEFGDFQCPFCRRMSTTLLQLRQKYGDRLRIVWKDFPLASHPHALPAAQAARCAAEQGRFWEYHDRLFVVRTFDVPALKRYAADLGLDEPRFAECVDSSKYAERVLRGRAEARALSLTSTPTTFVNGRLVKGARSYETFARLIEEELGMARR